MQKISEKSLELLDSFDACTLESVDKKGFMNRCDTKFILRTEDLYDVLLQLKKSYQVLSIDGRRLFRYNNQYFDTKDLKLYRQHHNGKLNRYKVRYRQYVDTDTCFFEVKYKTNKNRTIKERVAARKIQSHISGKAESQLSRKLNIETDNLLPQLKVCYDRATFVNFDIPEKITIDTNLYFKNSVKESELPGLVLMEIKQDSYSYNTESFRILKSMNIHPVSLSKYCTGTILTHDDIKYNKFKNKMLFINKVMNGNYGQHQLFGNTVTE